MQVGQKVEITHNQVVNCLIIPGSIGVVTSTFGGLIHVEVKIGRKKMYASFHVDSLRLI